MTELSFDDVVKAHQRIKDHIINTPVFSSAKLNEELKAQVFFKLDNQQKTKSFKVRGAFNAVLAYKEKYGNFPEKIVAQSSGNHAQAVALVGKVFAIPTLVFMSSVTSLLKIQATRDLGAEVIICEKRIEANRKAEEKAKEGYFFIHPSGNEDIIAGQGTACLEALIEIGEVDAIFAPCGGGGLVSGCYLAATGLAKKAQVFGCEPLVANDSAISLREGKIFHFDDSPKTIADGARTLAITEICFHYLKKISGIIELSEEEIIFWQDRLLEILGQKIEPTAALSLAGAIEFIKQNKGLKNPKLLLMISGGNV